MKLPEQLVESVTSGLAEDSEWAKRWSELWERPDETPSVHLAIFVDPYLSYILKGKKTIESRFSSRRTAPFGRVTPDDVLMLKVSGGPVVGLCRVRKVWSYQLEPDSWKEIRNRFAEPLCATEDSFWAHRKSAEYATLMQISDVLSISPHAVPKRDRRGWVVLEKGLEPTV